MKKIVSVFCSIIMVITILAGGFSVLADDFTEAEIMTENFNKPASSAGVFTLRDDGTIGIENDGGNVWNQSRIAKTAAANSFTTSISFTGPFSSWGALGLGIGLENATSDIVWEVNDTSTYTKGLFIYLKYLDDTKYGLRLNGKDADGNVKSIDQIDIGTIEELNANTVKTLRIVVTDKGSSVKDVDVFYHNGTSEAKLTTFTGFKVAGNNVAILGQACHVDGAPGASIHSMIIGEDYLIGKKPTTPTTTVPTEPEVVEDLTKDAKVITDKFNKPNGAGGIFAQLKNGSIGIVNDAEGNVWNQYRLFKDSVGKSYTASVSFSGPILSYGSVGLALGLENSTDKLVWAEGVKSSATKGLFVRINYFTDDKYGLRIDGANADGKATSEDNWIYFDDLEIGNTSVFTSNKVKTLRVKVTDKGNNTQDVEIYFNDGTGEKLLTKIAGFKNAGNSIGLLAQACHANEGAGALINAFSVNGEYVIGTADAKPGDKETNTGENSIIVIVFVALSALMALAIIQKNKKHI